MQEVVSLVRLASCKGTPLMEWWKCQNHYHSFVRSPLYGPPTPIKVLLTTTLQPLTMELSGSLAHGARLVEQFLEHEPSPEKMMRFECELGALLREVGRRIVRSEERRVGKECRSGG